MLLRFLLFFGIFCCVSGLYFLVEGEKKCFSIEQPADTPVTFSYEILDDGHEISFELYYGALSLPDMVIISKLIGDSKGHIDFTADNDGFYSYCLRQTSQNGVASRVRLAVNYGFDKEHYESLVQDQNFDSINIHVHKLNDILTLTLNEADYQKHKEVEYHDQTEMMNNAALWWPVLQIGILIITGVYQVHHLKSFFKSNKLI